MSKKSLLYLLLLLLLPGNIHLVYCCFAEKAEYKVEGNKNSFLCRWQNNCATVTVENGNISMVGAAAENSEFSWVVMEHSFLLSYNLTAAIDYNKDFIADYIWFPGGKEYIQIGGKLVSVSKVDRKKRTAVLPDGKVMKWQNGSWQ